MSELAKKVCLHFVKSLHERVGEALENGVQPDDRDWMETFLILFALEECQDCFPLPDKGEKPICRFSMGLSKNEMKAKLQKELKNNRKKWLKDKYEKDAASMLRESLVDFSMSNYSLARAAGDPASQPIPEDARFKLLMIAESEMGTKIQVLEDFLKLSCVESSFKMMIFKARKRKKDESELVAGFERIIRIARKPHDDAEWLFIGVPGYKEWIGDWHEPFDLPKQVHYLSSNEDKLERHNEWWEWPK